MFVLRPLGADSKREFQVIRMVGESQEQLVGAGAGGATGSNKTPTLEEYGTNLTTQANEVCHSNRLLTALKCQRMSLI